MRVPLDVRHALRSLRRHWKLTIAAAGGRVMASLLYGIATSDAAAIGGRS